MQLAIQALSDKITEAKSMRGYFENRLKKLNHNYASLSEKEEVQHGINYCIELENDCLKALNKLRL